MAKEGEPPQSALFSTEFADSSPSVVAVIELEIGETTLKDNKNTCDDAASVDVGLAEAERPKPTIREVRAARSLLYNRLLLEMVQRRIEKAEAIVLSYLLTQEDTSAQIGPYLIEMDANDEINVTKTEDEDGWFQLYFSNLEEGR